MDLDSSLPGEPEAHAPGHLGLPTAHAEHAPPLPLGQIPAQVAQIQAHEVGQRLLIRDLHQGSTEWAENPLGGQACSPRCGPI